MASKSRITAAAELRIAEQFIEAYSVTPKRTRFEQSPAL